MLIHTDHEEVIASGVKVCIDVFKQSAQNDRVIIAYTHIAQIEGAKTLPWLWQARRTTQGSQEIEAVFRPDHTATVSFDLIAFEDTRVPRRSTAHQMAMPVMGEICMLQCEARPAGKAVRKLPSVETVAKRTSAMIGIQEDTHSGDVGLGGVAYPYSSSCGGMPADGEVHGDHCKAPEQVVIGLTEALWSLTY
jgi:hypothetical protein